MGEKGRQSCGKLEVSDQEMEQQHSYIGTSKKKLSFLRIFRTLTKSFLLFYTISTLVMATAVTSPACP